MSSWTPERKARQANAIHRWKPWQRSTGPTTPEGKARASRNAYKGGLWLELRGMRRMVNAEIRRSRELVDRLT